MALANGADTHKMKYGHRGGNHPVRDLADGTRLHFLPEPWLCGGYRYVWIRPLQYRRLKMSTMERMRDWPIRERISFTVQYHPEACPGPRDSAYLFDRFMKMMEGE